MYEIVIDSGIPYSIFAKTQNDVLTELARLDNMYKSDSDSYPCFDVWIYEGENDVTETFFNDLKVKLKVVTNENN